MPEEGLTVLEYLRDGTAIGFFSIGIYAFYKGLVMPKSTVDTMLTSQKEAGEKSAEIIGDKLTKGMRSAVKSGIAEGIAAGYLKIAEINGDRESTP